MSKSRVSLRVVSVLMLGGLIRMTNLWAQAPNSISYSGLLTDARGEPREGQFNMTFRIYDSLLGGTPLHQQTIDNVIVRKGQFSVLLGPSTNPNVQIPAAIVLLVATTMFMTWRIAKI